MSEISERRLYTSEKTNELIGFLKYSEDILMGKACVYSTGSFGRREAGKNSDLDLFIVSKTFEGGAHGRDGALKQLDEICVKAELIKATKYFSIKEFDGDGRYLTHYTVDDLTQKLGSPEDDAGNTFTARLLLLLESSPLLGVGIYKEVIDTVIAAYWRDYADHQDEFVPAFLANDILRLWRTFCVNYEARTENFPEDKKIKRRQKNYTLKHSRLLTCYSALLFLLAIFEKNKTVKPDDIRTMVGLSPTERLEWLVGQPDLCDASDDIKNILDKYEKFLVAKNDDINFKKMFETSGDARKNMKSAYEFAELFFVAINKVGRGNKLHKLLLV